MPGWGVWCFSYGAKQKQKNICVPLFNLRRDYSSILDLTLASVDFETRNPNWCVSDIESLSDHNFILLVITEEKPSPSRTITTWQVRKLDREKLLQLTVEDPERTIHSSARGLTYILNQVCDQTMHRRISSPKKQPVYEKTTCLLAQARKEYMRKRRRSVRRNQPKESQRLWEDYKESKRSLQNSVKDYKRKRSLHL
ncbi:hypothetical protein JTB14_002259 [Gonioctena quinquepunctata]|nr:hypothetical protein JTB14_002259 [Gonioctena quinquepunctata]